MDAEKLADITKNHQPSKADRIIDLLEQVLYQLELIEMHTRDTTCGCRECR